MLFRSEERRQSLAAPSPTRGSPSPFFDRPASPAAQQQQPRRQSAVPVQERRQSAVPAPVFAQERRQSQRPPPLPPASPVVRQTSAPKDKGKAPVKILAFAEGAEADGEDLEDELGDDLADGVDEEVRALVFRWLSCWK